MLTAAVLSLEPVDEVALPVSHGRLALASALDLFLRLDPNLAHSLHSSQAPKPFTAGYLTGFSQGAGHMLTLPASGRCYWRLTGLNAEVSATLQMLSPGCGGVRLGEAVFRILDVALHAADHAEAGQERYSDLLSRTLRDEPEVGEITLSFVSPTTFRRGTVEHPFPLPSLVWGSLLRRWNRWSTVPAMPAEEVEDVISTLEEAVILSNWKGETRRVELGNRRTVGFIGRFSYRVREPHSALRPLIALLARFAFYAGVGWQTTHGLGQVRVVTRAPHRRR